jgi:hypothetical protein
MGIFNPRPRAKDTQGTEINRRKGERQDPAHIPSLKSAGLVAGPDVQLINLSSGGALLESNTRILPDASICIRLVATDALFFLRGRVLQSRASSLRGSELIYECRVAFDEEFSLLAPNQEEQPAVDEAADVPSTENAAGANEYWPAVLEEGPNSTLTVTVPVPRLERDLRHVFGL